MTSFSAFIEDTEFSALPKDVKADVLRFVDAKAGTRFIHYGMVVKELIGKADPANLKTARAHVKKLSAKKAFDAVKMATAKGEKYILLMNDRIVDGHHFLAKAEKSGITSSLNVLDLTPSRFQFSAGKRPVLFGRIQPSSLRKEFAVGGVSQDRYKKNLHEQDVEKASGHYTKSAIAGAGLGLALRKTPMPRSRAALLGAGVGVSAQLVTRAATATTKDRFDDRSPGGKLVDKLVPIGIGAGALFAGKRRIGAKYRAVKGHVKTAVTNAGRAVKGAVPSPGQMARVAMGFSARSRALLHGGALAGGIAIADGITSAAMPDKGMSRTDAAKHGLVKGGIYGTALAIAEPALMSGFKRAVRYKRAVKLSARFKLVQFGGRDQLKGRNGQNIDPTKVATGEKEGGYFRDSSDGGKEFHPEDVPLAHAQVLRATWNKAKVAQRYVRRGGALAGDVVGAATGKPKEGGRKREWEKSWFKNAVGSAVVAGGIMAHNAKLKKDPDYRKTFVRRREYGKSVVNSVVPDFFPDTHAAPAGELGRAAKAAPGKVWKSIKSTGKRVWQRFFSAVHFDATASDWDVRDARGRSARVFAPGARPRERREKKWHETMGAMRKIAIAGAVLGTGIGAYGGYKWATRGTAPLRKRPGAAGKIIRPDFATVAASARQSAIHFEEEKKKSSAPLLGAALAGLGTYAALRKRGKAVIPGGSKGFTRVHQHIQEPSRFKKFLTEVARPADKHVHITAGKKHAKNASTVNAVFDPYDTGRFRAESQISTHDATSKAIHRSKLDEYATGKKLGLDLPHTAPLGDARKLGKDYIAKPNKGYQAKSVITAKDIAAHDPNHPDLKAYKKVFADTGKKYRLKQITDDDMMVARNTHAGYRRGMAEAAIRKPHKFVRQKAIDIDSEYRVHAVGGKAIGITSSRHSAAQAILGGGNKDAEKALEKSLRNVHPSLKKNMVAADVAKDKRGKWHLIETNPGPFSGFLTPKSADPRGPNQLYKAVTGRNSRQVAGTAAAGAAVATGAALSPDDKKPRRRAS